MAAHNSASDYENHHSNMEAHNSASDNENYHSNMVAHGPLENENHHSNMAAHRSSDNENLHSNMEAHVPLSETENHHDDMADQEDFPADIAQFRADTLCELIEGTRMVFLHYRKQKAYAVQRPLPFHLKHMYTAWVSDKTMETIRKLYQEALAICLLPLDVLQSELNHVMRLRTVSVFTHQIKVMFAEINEEIARVENTYSNPGSNPNTGQSPQRDSPLVVPEANGHLPGVTLHLRKEE